MECRDGQRFRDNYRRGALRRGSSSAQSRGADGRKCAKGEISTATRTDSEPLAARGAGSARRGGIAPPRVCRLLELLRLHKQHKTFVEGGRDGARGLEGEGRKRNEDQTEEQKRARKDRERNRCSMMP
jgi:hypothetical protein